MAQALESGGGRREVRPAAASCVGSRRTYSSGVAPCGASGAHAIPPTLCSPIGCWLQKVAISLQRCAIFQHKGVLSYLTFTYSCHVLPSCLQVAFKMAQDRNLGPTWPHLGLILAPKRPPRAPGKPHLQQQNDNFVWEGSRFSMIPSCVQYVAVRPPPGPRSAG